MKVEYKRDIKRNYMVIWKPEESVIEPYCIRMVEETISDTILLMQQHSIDDQMLFYYEITGRQSMLHLFEKKLLSYGQLKLFMKQILSALELAYEHLLPEDDFLLIPEYIYLDIVTNMPSLCFLPGYRKDSRKQMSSLLEYLMNKVDYGDKEAVTLVYQLYAASREEGFTLAHILRILDKKDSEEVNSRTSRVRMEIEAEDEKGEKGIKTAKSALDMRRPGSNLSVDNSMRQAAVGHSSNGKEAGKKRIGRQEVSREGGQEQRHGYGQENIPVVMERLEEEREVWRYPITAYLLTGVCSAVGILVLVLGFTSGILYNSYGGRIEYGKLLGLILVLLCVEAYLMRIIWNGNNRLAKIMSIREYIDPRQEDMEAELPLEDTADSADMDAAAPALEPSRLTGRERSIWQTMLHREEAAPEGLYTGIGRSEEECSPTCILNGEHLSQVTGATVLLKSVDETLYTSVPVTEFPFFIGKLRKNVDYCLQKSAVSRYHAKITKEEDKYYITDLNSTNGTYVNETRLNSYENWELEHGDRVALADLVFEFTLNAG